MKGLKKLALVSAIAAAPFAAQAELKAMNDAAMGDVTGQAGVTIELQTQVDIGSFVYTDEGSFTVNTIKLGGAQAAATGANAVTVDFSNLSGTAADAKLGGKLAATTAGTSTALLDNIYIDIDVLADGDAVIALHTINGLPIDWGFAFDSATLSGGGESTTVLSNFKAYGALTGLEFTVDTTTDTLGIAAAFTVEEMNMDIPFLAVGIRGMSITNNNPAYVAAIDAAHPWLSGELATSTSGFGTAAAGTNSAVAYMTMGVGTSSRVAGDVLQIGVDTFAADVKIDSVIVGGASIGSVAFNDLVISNTVLKVYGH